jgi:glycosyltransferase involved in cell wall biosynthesis
MTGGPLVSVVVIFLNEERFLEQAVRSILEQSWERWELFLVDDGSDDGSTDLARAFAAQDPDRIHYLEHPGHENLGMSASRNLGIWNSAGEYIAFLDGDDVWLPRKLERQLAILTSHPEAGMVFGKTEYWFSWDDDAAGRERDYVPAHGIEADVIAGPPGPLALFLSGKAAHPCSCSLLVRREAVQAVGGFEDSFRGLYEDQAFYAKICIARPVFISDKCLERYRQHPESICSTTVNSLEEMTARVRYLQWLRDYLIRRGVTDEDLWRSLHRELWLLGHVGGSLPPNSTVRVRWAKKWLLRLEEILLPDAVQRLLWGPPTEEPRAHR